MNYKLLPKERPPRYVELPPPMTKCHAGRDVRNKALKIILALLFVAALLPLNGFAAKVGGYGWIGKNCNNVFNHVATIEEPWNTIQLCIRTYDGKYWKDDYDIVGNYKGPVILYYAGNGYQEICNPIEELCWADEAALSAERKYNTWWKNTYTNTVNGIKFTVRFWDPRKDSDGNYWVDIVIDQDWYELNSSYAPIFIIEGASSESNFGDNDVYCYTDPLPVPKTPKITPVRTEYGKMSVTGNIIDWGVTDGTYYLNTNFGEGSDKLTQYNVGDEFSFTDVSCPEGDTYGNYSDFKLEQVCKVPARTYSTSTGDQDHIQTNLWYNYCYPCKDYVRAKNITGSFDKWDKEMDLSWELEGSTNPGTWSIFSYPTDDPSQRGLVASNIPAGTTKYSAPAKDFFTDYTYDVAFVPNNSPQNTILDRLMVSADARSDISFSIKTDSIVAGESTIKLSWQAEPYKGTLPFSYNILRRDSQLDEWEQVGTKGITSQEDVKFTYVDNNDLSACTGYQYQIQANLFNGIYTASSDTTKIVQLEGRSKVTAVSTTKGDYQGMVKVTWEAKQVDSNPTKYELLRRVKGTQTWASIYKVSGTDTYYSYEDNTAQPGLYYDYKVVSTSSCGSSETQLFETDEGFCRSTGIVSGRITYGTGTAVKDARVSIVKNSETASDASQFYAISTQEAGDGLYLDLDGKSLNEKFKDKDFSVQMMVRPNEVQNAGNPVFFSIGDQLSLRLGELTDDGYKVLLAQGDTAEETGLTLPANEYTSLTLSVNSSNWTRLTAINKLDSVKVSPELHILRINFDESAKSGVCMGGSYALNVDNAFSGYIDEMRLFSGKALTTDEILKNYNHLLAGTEDGLFAYWPVDEGINGQTFAYDYSKTSGVANGNHARFGGVKTSVTSEIVPESNQLSLFAYTDAQGNFVVRGVPFSGDGTNYMVVPTLGIHEFSPQYSTRYVSASSLVHSGVDFTDVSAFPVSGYVYYEGTDYPVEGCNFYVDGDICSKDGQLVTSASDGSFTISVPIGDHFIEVRKDGHVFASSGRYPADPNETGERLTFEKPVSNLEFIDKTLVNFSGRVVGGSTEGNKPLGFGESANNIGITELVLTPNVGRPKPRRARSIWNVMTSSSRSSVPSWNA